MRLSGDQPTVALVRLRPIAGTWSRRITDEHRLVYLVDNDDFVILQAHFHYK